MAHFHAPLKHLARSAQELAEEVPGLAKRADAAPVYPYGCCLSLDEETMEKLGIGGEDPEVGDIIHFCCEAKVRAIPGEREGMDGNTVKSGCVELQITHMGVPAAPDSARADRWYDTDNDGE